LAQQARPFAHKVVQVPLPDAVQVSHVPGQVVLQQTPERELLTTQWPLAQEASPRRLAHTSPFLSLHAPALSQIRVPLHTAVATRSSASLTVAQVPSLPARAHDWHVSVQAVPQHNPSLQKPVAHSAPLVQDWPLPSLQAPAESQTCPAGHRSGTRGAVG
jgi:hypothetical protein